ncbi:type II toxin-antitoxin system Phd/YefM family antitoxin [Ketogulonicigenium vulgare]|uniref:Antitoxin n=2 Tax=Ketogulonicigenium vulgare TaxID=92945 RepID=F9Y4P5_KETVW|nr:type II toxin-antitoxin system prevent-host-death family antitoxin [Ketogulonicigenium vulgare]AEM40602.1 Prevent-host-death family protein [Ketogulonicigenium vulgare WSH-001]ALJ80777.1 prevent-host-death protein [Ketogulonicigenium vulgare]ANW34986.1 prevent-host-death protein [Ketogulonicigenium vulgare]
MRVPITKARTQLAELVRRAESGEDVELTRHGHAAVRLVPVHTVLSAKDRRVLFETFRKSGAAKASAGVSAARSQDFLYDDETGLPR